MPRRKPAATTPKQNRDDLRDADESSAALLEAILTGVVLVTTILVVTK